MNKLHRSSRINKKKLTVITLAVLVLAFLTLLILEKTHTTDLVKIPGRNARAQDAQKAQTTSNQPSAQSTFNGGEPRSTDTTNKTEGTVTDTRGTTSTAPSESSWTKSTSGTLVVYTPTQNSILINGQTLSGSSASDRISFRLIDNVSGVISRGSLSVVNGKFSGIFSFTTKATEGRLDVFTASPDGTESNNVSIPVRF